MNDSISAAPMENLIPPEMTVVFVIRHYFTMLRQEKGHKPEASPLDLELLLIVKFVTAAGGNVIDVLRKIGIIIINYKIAINGGTLKDFLISSRSRINNTLSRLNWSVVKAGNDEKFHLFSPLLDRSDVRNWTIHEIPPETALYMYIRENPEIQYLNMTDDSATNISLDSIDPLVTDVQPQHDLSQSNPLEIKNTITESMQDFS